MDADCYIAHISSAHKATNGISLSAQTLFPVDRAPHALKRSGQDPLKSTLLS